MTSKDAEFAEVGGKRVRAKTFTYTVREVRPDNGSVIAGVAYDGHVATMTVTVTDDGSGNLTATTPAIAEVSGGDFVNTYTTELEYSARAGVRLSKTLSGRAMEAGAVRLHRDRRRRDGRQARPQDRQGRLRRGRG